MTEATPGTPEKPPVAPPSGSPPPASPPTVTPPADGGKPPGAAPPTLAAGGDKGGDKAVTAPADWPEDWRTRLGGADEKIQERLKRFASPQAMWESYRALEQKLSSGELKANTPFPDKGTPEQQAEWRKAQGVPDTHEGYLKDINLGDGLVLGEADKPAVENFAKAMHALNASPAVVQGAIKAHMTYLQQEADKRTEADDALRQSTEDKLRTELGTEYRSTMNGLHNWVSSLPDAFHSDPVTSRDGAILFNGRTADGKLIGDDPRMIQFFTQLARELNPAGTVVPGFGPSQAKAIDDRLAEISKYAREKPDEYGRDEKVRAERLELLRAKERLAGRKAA